MHDLADRLAHRVQLTTDGHRPYLEAVESAFGTEIDYATLQKIYGIDREAETRYSLLKACGAPPPLAAAPLLNGGDPCTPPGGFARRSGRRRSSVLSPQS